MDREKLRPADHDRGSFVLGPEGLGAERVSASGKFRVWETPLRGVLLLEPKLFGDQRGFFLESYSRRDLAELGITEEFVQDNHSRSRRGVLRGLHYQVKQTQAKLVRVVAGEAFDAVADLRRSSPGFGRWFGAVLSAENRRMLWIPKGFAHGFLVLSEAAELAYKASDYYAPEHERTLRWDDATVAIAWPLSGAPIVSAKDAAGDDWQHAEMFP